MEANKKEEHPSTYVVQDRSNEEELTRLTIQDQMITRSMGGVWPEQSNPASFQRVLDIACGSGVWCIDAALAYPTLTAVGIDISKRMIDYAREQAIVHGVNDRVEFHSMDALRMLEFANNSFDLVNLRFGISFMRTWDWPKLFDEMLRVARLGGVVRVTEPELVHKSNSPALTEHSTLGMHALYHSGHLFEDAPTGLTSHLEGLFVQHRCASVQTRTYALEYQAGTPEGRAYCDDVMHGMHTVRPFVLKWARNVLPEEYDALTRQTLIEIQQPDFQATWKVLTAWGLKARSRPKSYRLT